MRASRIRYDGAQCYHHCFNRTGGTREDLVFGDAEKRALFDIATRLQVFYTVEVISFVSMSNHFHIVMSTSDALPTREEAARRYEAYYGESRPTPLWELDPIYLKHAGRMRDFSCFMKDLQQLFTNWYNKSRPVRRHGRLWADRFKNVLLEDGPALWKCVEYVEMNPVRAGICDAPGDYAFSTWGRWKSEGVHPYADNVVKHMGDVLGKPDETPKIDDVLRELEARVTYATALERGASVDDAQAVYQEIRSKNKLNLTRRTRYWTNAGVIGSTEFVRNVVAKLFGEERAVKKRLTKTVAVTGDVLHSYRHLRDDG